MCVSTAENQFERGAGRRAPVKLASPEGLIIELVPSARAAAHLKLDPGNFFSMVQGKSASCRGWTLAGTSADLPRRTDIDMNHGDWRTPKLVAPKLRAADFALEDYLVNPFGLVRKATESRPMAGIFTSAPGNKPTYRTVYLRLREGGGEVCARPPADRLDLRAEPGSSDTHGPGSPDTGLARQSRR